MMTSDAYRYSAVSNVQFAFLIAVQAAHVVVTLGLMRDRSRQTATTPTPAYLCSCTHGFSFHDPDTGACVAEVERQEEDGFTEKWYPCRCRRFVGTLPPDLVVDQFRPHLTDRES
jgi:hypothetical protein